MALKLMSIWKHNSWYRRLITMTLKRIRLSAQSSFHSFRLMMRIGRITLSISIKWLRQTLQSRIVLLSIHLWPNFCQIVNLNELSLALIKKKYKVHIIRVASTCLMLSFKTSTTTDYCAGSTIWANHTWIIVCHLANMAQLVL